MINCVLHSILYYVEQAECTFKSELNIYHTYMAEKFGVANILANLLF